MLRLIKDINGDVLGVILFALLIAYFCSVANKSWIKYVLMIACVLTLSVNASIVIKCMRQKKQVS